MDRLTKRMDGISYIMCDNVIISKCEDCDSREPSCYTEDCRAQLDIITKLAQYEDTGLTPEQIEALKSENTCLRAEIEQYKWVPVTERLPDKNGVYDISLDDCDTISTFDFFQNTKFGFKDRVTAWRPLSKPYAPEEKR